jgi:hypothetical protein
VNPVVRSQDVPEMTVTALSDEMEVELAKGRSEADRSATPQLAGPHATPLLALLAPVP